MKKTEENGKRDTQRRKKAIFRLMAKREKAFWNNLKYGTTNGKIIHNAFIEEAREKIDIHLSLLWIGFIALWLSGWFALFASLAFIFHVWGMPLKENIMPRAAAMVSGLLYLLLLGKAFRAFRRRVFQKYWRCPHCGAALPYEYRGRNEPIRLLPGAEDAICPNCNKQL